MSEQEPLEKQIENVISNEIRPYIEMDGGQIYFVEMKDQVVYVRLAGACGSCPSSISGTLMAIEGLLKRDINPYLEVEAA